MLVVDTKRSEVGPQRRKAADGRLLHCCCICGTLGVWGAGWSTYCSDAELDESRPIPKFCSVECRRRGGRAATNVTHEMKQAAKDSEWRAPEVRWREATDREKYNEARFKQSSKSTAVPHGGKCRE